VPSDGGLALPKDVEVKPLSPKGLLNTNLDILVFTLTRGSNGFLGGHVDLDRDRPSLEQNSFQGILVVKVPTAPFGLEIVQQEASENVEGLLDIGVPSDVVSVKVRGVIFLFDHGLA
jgi:hypothetical protein